MRLASLYKLLEAVDVLESWHARDVEIEGIAYNSQQVKPGDIFVCIKGFKTDGHAYMMSAIAAGAVAVIVEDYQEGWDVPQFRVANSRLALAALSARFYHDPSTSMKLIGITATNGKTSTSYMTNAILEQHGLKTGLIGTVVVKIDDVAEPSKLTTPESLDLQRYFDRMRAAGVSHVTMEVSSSALELSRVGSVDFDIVALNNISREHIDLHGSFEQYFKHKSNLIRQAGCDKIAILNLDCPYAASLVDQTEAQVVTYGVEQEDGIFGVRDIDLSTGRARFTVVLRQPLTTASVHIDPQQFDIELRTPGFHSVYNSMVAIITALLNGIPVSTIQQALLAFRGVERRFEIVYENDFKIIDDHFANKGNIDVTLGTLARMDYAQLRLVYAIRGSRGPTVNRENAEAIATWAPKLGIKEVIATLSQSHVTEKDVVTEEELAVFEQVMEEAGIRVHLYPELPDAISHALFNTDNDDLVLLAGCQGMDAGAKIVLEQLVKLRPDLDAAQILKPLEHRVAGVG